MVKCGVILKKCIRERVDKNVWFYGSCYDEQTNAELIYNADMCVAPGNVGLTAIHAMTLDVLSLRIAILNGKCQNLKQFIQVKQETFHP